MDKTALIKSSSEMYSQHFCLIAQHFNDPAKAFSIIEQVRGRVTTDLLMAGAVTSQTARTDERTISQLQVKLMSARSTAQVRSIRDQIFMAEQTRWVTPDVSILKARAHETIALRRVEGTVSPSTFILEYVVASPHSYCLVISHVGTRIVPLASSERINKLVVAYLKAVKAKQAAREEGRQLYDILLRPVAGFADKETLVVVPDGSLHLLPFEGLVDDSGRYVVETHNRIVLLVNEWTNSAAEMVAGFAAEHRLATIVGTKTAGNVLGAANFNVGAGYWVRLPVFGWYTSKGDCLEGKGVSPHVLANVDPYVLNAGTDQQMDKALEIVSELGNGETA